MRTIATLGSAARLMIQAAPGVEGTDAGRRFVQDAQEFLDAAHPLLEGGSVPVTIEDREAASTAAIVLPQAGALIPAKLADSAFVQRSALKPVLQQDLEAVRIHLGSFQQLQGLGWTLGFLLDPAFSPPRPQDTEHAFTTGAWLRLAGAEVSP